MAAESLLLGACLCLVCLAWGAMIAPAAGKKFGTRAEMVGVRGVARPERACEQPEFNPTSTTPFQGVPPAADIGAKIRQSVGSIVALLGAGIYEELLFRLILLSLLVWGLRKAGIAPGASTLLAVIVSSLLFAAAHHVGPYGEAPLMWSRFVFRTLAGVFFSVVFLYRGFGIAAGSHAAYDVLVSLL